MMKRSVRVAAALVLLSVSGGPGWSDDVVFEIEMKDGVITPQRIEVPANTRFKIVIDNQGASPAEFECTELHKEEVVPAGSKGRLIFRSLDPGEYVCIDEFQPDGSSALLVVK
jgi:hypothetical protein